MKEKIQEELKKIDKKLENPFLSSKVIRHLVSQQCLLLKSYQLELEKDSALKDKEIKDLRELIEKLTNEIEEARA